MSDYEKISQPENKIESEDEIAARLKAKLSQKYTEPIAQKIQTAENIADFADKLKEKYHDCTSYRLFHTLAFSGQELSTPFTHFDFLGEDSIQAFIERL
jgi:hypothetical protein